MKPEPVVSIIVNNYNYGRFLKEAIDSALNQSYPKIEVIVVDDGSTDDSRQIIANYGQRIIPVLKDNGGQASALNAGFAHSHGDVVIFLDADDILLPNTVERVVGIFQGDPNISRVQYRLEIMDATGERTGVVMPPLYMPLPSGDLRGKVIDLVNYLRSPTSGNAFAAWTLRRILPMPESAFRLCADYYLLRVNALCAPVESLDEVGAYYRSHGSNGYFVPAINLDQIRQNVAFEYNAHVHIKCFADSLGFDRYPGNVAEVPDEVFLAQRMISRKLDPKQHPVKNDTLLSLCWRGISTALRRPSLSLAMKFLHTFWFFAMLFVPRWLAPWLAEQFVPETRVSFNKILEILQGEQKHAQNSKGFYVETQQAIANH